MTVRRGNVLHFIDTTGPGGAETVFLQVANGLNERGWPGRVVLVGAGWVLDRVNELGLPVDVIPTGGRLDWRLLTRLHTLVRRHEINLIHAHLLSPAVYAGALGLWTGTPVVATLHGASDTEPGGWGRRLRFRLIRASSTVVCVSDALRSRLIANAGFGPDDVRVIHNGVDPQAFAAADGAKLRSAHGIPEDAILVGALGNVRPAKDYPTFFRAAASLADDNRLRFAVAGQRTEPLYGRLIDLRDRLGLSERFAFWGFQNDPAAVVAAFDVLVISSSSEGFSLAAVQAMAAGTPVIATRSGGPEEIITDGRNGFLVPPAEPDMLAARIRAVLDDHELQRRVTAHATRTVSERFSLEAMFNEYGRTYSLQTERYT